jgi:hypothetical protein
VSSVIGECPAVGLPFYPQVPEIRRNAVARPPKGRNRFFAGVDLGAKLFRRLASRLPDSGGAACGMIQINGRRAEQG